MSFWAHVGIEIKRPDLFEKACQQFGLRYEAETNKIFLGIREVGQIEETKEGARLYMDTDEKWSLLARTIGSDGRKLMQEYSKEVIKEHLYEMGGIISSEELQTDGTIRLHINIGEGEI